MVRDASGRILLIRRAPHDVLLMHLREDRPGIAWPGYWTPIGGCREADESARGARSAGGRHRDHRAAAPPRHHDLGLPLTRVLYALWNGPDSDLRLGGEGLAVRMVPFDEVINLKVPPYMHPTSASCPGCFSCGTIPSRCWRPSFASAASSGRRVRT
ncbi:hypothetical protein [Kitasatospora sp. NPDC085464]|uniref:hypothetical protein n=1 Tax=Kitasatospora sp. NPDC085464 TaxID=3364063 RepID=UPI0037CC7A7A